MKCPKCGLDKDISHFLKDESFPSGRTDICSQCQEDKRTYYERNRQSHIKVCSENTKKHRQSVRQKVYDFKKSLGCQVVGCTEIEPCCLDFHHLEEQDSIVGILTGRGCSWERIKAEIAKCTLVCANCHRKIHAGLISSPDETLRKHLGDINVSRVRFKKTHQLKCKQCGKEFVSVKKKDFCSTACVKVLSRKTEWPSKEELAKEVKTNSFLALGKKYGVSDNSVRRWCRNYGIEI